jgi:cobalt-zinc-cadmium resistance protein CzcA
VQALRTGIDVGSTYSGPVRIPIRLRLGDPAGALQVREVALPSAARALIPLGRVADVRSLAAPALINHLAGERRLMVGFNVRGSDLGDVVERVRARVARSTTVPRGYRLTWGGQYENLQAASRRLALVIPGVLVLIVVVLVIAFRRLRPALIIFTNVPFACVGGVCALALRGMPVSISAAIGFIALSGVAVLNGVVLMSRVLMEEEAGASPEQAAERAAHARARPVLMTALVAALGFIPMMLAHGVGAEVQRPLATVVVGGLVTSTLLTLVILPVLYPWFVSRRARATLP